MNEPVIVKHSFPIAAIAVLQAVMPAVVAVGGLYAVVAVYNVQLEDFFHDMAILVALLSLLLNRVPRPVNGQMVLGVAPIAGTVITRWMITLAVLLAVGYVTKFSEEFSRRVVLTWALITPAALIPVTLALQEILRRFMSDPSNVRRAVFVGCNECSLALAGRLKRSPDLGMSVEGFFDDRGRERLHVNGEVTLLGKLNELPAFVQARRIGVIFIALPVRQVQRVIDLVDGLGDTTAAVYYVPDIAVFDLIQARSGSIEGIPVISMCETPFAGYRGVVKRMTDVVIAAAVLLLAAPLMAAIMFAIRATSPGPVIFKQRRYGLDGAEITVYKFRTMNVMEDGPQIAQASPSDPRTTPVGRLLRRYSLDELPQLVNVLQGRMSLVGPRPHAVAHNEMYRKLIKGYMVRHKVLPGITGLAQVSGLRGETRTVEQMEARVRCDLEYLRSWSIELDLRILARTALQVLGDRKAF